MVSTGEVDYLLEATRSSVKRFGGDGPTLSHLAHVLSAKWEESFAEVFGERGSEDVALLLRRKSFVGDEAEVRSLLTQHDSQESVLTGLHLRLRGLIEAARAPEAPEPTAAEHDRAEAAAAQPDPTDESSWPERTRRFLLAVEPSDGVVEREGEINQVVAVLGRTRRRVPLILGRRGSGRTTLLKGIAHKLQGLAGPEEFQIWRIAPETMGADPGGPLGRIIEDCEAPTVLMVDDVDRLAALGTAEPNGAVLLQLRAALAHPHLRMVLVCEPRYYKRLEMLVNDFVESVAPVRLGPLADDTMRAVVRREVASIQAAHTVTISPALLAAACLPARPTDVAMHPGLALERLDAAASHASVLGNSEAGVADLAGLNTHCSRAMRAHELEKELSTRVKGQANAARAVAARLALTLARLDLRPERPDGVFLFVGPTGVGKTELARAISAALYGGEDRLIRLDMSEYAHEWGVSRLVGPMPGYVGSTEPEHWLTTRVAQMPECVVLLDEIEKAHPVVWNTFLQVFDAGRLTDSRGTTADFSNAVIIMTSNLGAAGATAPALGFANSDGGVNIARDRVTRAVKERMAPELINRIDELVVFDALGVDAIEEIAHRELADVVERLAESGWEVGYDGQVVKHLVSTGYDPAYGARHLHRNIERLFLGLIAQSDVRKVAVRVMDNELIRR